jgi:hypothetical protein
MMVQVALIAFAMFGVLTMVIDLGYLTLTHVQMQNAADAGAVEGLRKRNAVANDGFASDCLRRAAARDVVRWTFDDNLDLDSVDADSPQNFGAGPTVAFTGGDGTAVNAYQKIADLGVYKPNLGLNQSGNVQHGDMVSGDLPVDLAYLSDPRPSEDGSYGRNDFNRSPDSPGPTLTFSACPEPLPDVWPTPPETGPMLAGDTAFLLRLRRSSEAPGLTDPIDAFSTGPTLPLMFARGTAVHGDGSGYNPRTDGLTVRATAIAKIRPAMRVGLARFGEPGATPFTLDSTFAQSLGIVGSPVTIAADGTIHDGGGAVVGQFVVDPLSIATVGQAVPPAEPTACAPAAGYGPVYSAIGISGTLRVIGFVRIELDCTAGATLSRGAGLVAATNATGLLVEGLPPGIPTADVPLIMSANAALGAAGAALLAPVLAR